MSGFAAHLYHHLADCASMPEEEFEQMVESENPPTLSKLAKIPLYSIPFILRYDYVHLVQDVHITNFGISMDVKTINSANARKTFSDLLNESGFGGRRIVVTRKGKAVAAMVPIEDLETIQVIEDKMDIKEAKRILSDTKSKLIPWDQAKKELIKG